MKKCSCCGKEYKIIPIEAKLHLDVICPGWYFNCECKSTLVWPIRIEEKNEGL